MTLDDRAKEQLEQQGCSADDWGAVSIDPRSIPFIRNTTFRGQVHVDLLGSEVEYSYSVGDPDTKVRTTKTSSLSNCLVKDSSIGEGCYVANVPGGIVGSAILEGAYVENVASIASPKSASFGEGVLVNLFSGLEADRVELLAELSFSLAALLVFCKGDRALRKRLERLLVFAKKNAPVKKAVVGRRAVLRHCGDLLGVWVGDGAELSHTGSLVNGSVFSSRHQKTYLQEGVVAKNFIVREGCRITEHSLVERAFVGRHVHLGKACSVRDSLVFDHSVVEHSEVSRMFLGPHSVSGHRSSLLIAAQASFFNAGSGTNASNHLYRLGAHHWGYFERGAKTGSNAYALHPSRIGFFSTLIGQPKTHIDTSPYPFSVVVAQSKRTYLYPGKNIFSIGVARDLIKWRERTPPSEQKAFDFGFDNGYILLRVFGAWNKLKEAGSTQGFLIAEHDRNQGQAFYLNFLKRHLLPKILKSLSEPKTSPDKKTKALLLEPKTSPNNETKVLLLEPKHWLDLGSHFLSRPAIEWALRSATNEGNARPKPMPTTASTFQNLLDEAAGVDRSLELFWLAGCFEKVYKKPSPESLSQSEWNELLDDWEEAEGVYCKALLVDARRDVDRKRRMNYGVFGDPNEHFDHVRGALEADPVVQWANEKLRSLPEARKQLTRLIPN